MPFRDRRDAGRRLGAALKPYRGERPVVLALPRGGVPVADEVATALDAPLDILIVRKIGAPGHAEFAIGAIAPGAVLLNHEVISRLGISKEYVERTVAAETRELERRIQAYRGDRPELPVSGHTVILVDDGLATGASARAAVEALRHRNPRRIVFAAPVGAPESVSALRSEADAVVCLETPKDFRAVSLYYRDFAATTDEEVLACMARHSARPGT